jgi:hypothetical protein
MSKDKSVWTDEDSVKVLKEIEFENLTVNGLDVSSAAPITVNADVQLQDGDAWTIHNDILTGGLGANDVITVTLDDLDLDTIDTSSSGIKQMDLFKED